MTAVIVPTPTVVFDPNNPKYKCCCDHCHVKTGTTVIAVLYVIVLVFEAVELLLQIAIGNRFGVINPLVSLIIGVPVVVFLFLGLKHERAGYLLPYLVVQVIGIVMLCSLTIGLVIVLAVGSIFDWFKRDEKKGQYDFHDDSWKTWVVVGVVIGIVLLLLLIGLSIWCFLVVQKCYIYFKEKAFGSMTYGPEQVTVAYSGYPGYPAYPGYPGGYPVVAQTEIFQPPPYNPQHYELKQ